MKTRCFILVMMMQTGVQQDQFEQCAAGGCLRPPETFTASGSPSNLLSVKLQEWAAPLQQRYIDDGVEEFYIALDQKTYAPGDTVVGKLVLNLSTAMECDDFTLSIRGQGVSVFYFNEKIDGRLHLRKAIGRMAYVYDRRSVWGEVRRTSIIHEAGKKTRFGLPWLPTEGVMYLSVDSPDSIINIQILDWDQTTSDDVLGSISRRAAELANSSVQDLTLKVDPQGSVRLRGQWVNASEVLAANLRWNGNVMQTHKLHLKLTVVSVSNLTSGDMIDRNDVYVQVDAIPDRKVCERTNTWTATIFEVLGMGGMDCSRPFTPLRSLEKGFYELPFSFSLPDELPTAYEAADANVRYSVRAQFGNLNNGKMNDDYSTRTYFTVAPAKSPSSFVVPVHASSGGSYGQVSLRLHRSEYAPNDRLKLYGEIQNLNSTSRYFFRIVTRLYLMGFDEARVEEYDHHLPQRWFGQFVGRKMMLWEKTLQAGETFDFSHIEEEIVVPSWASTYWPGHFEDLPGVDWGHRFDGWEYRNELETLDSARWRYDLEIIRESASSWSRWIGGVEQEKVLRLPIVITSYRGPNMVLGKADEPADLLAEFKEKTSVHRKKNRKGLEDNLVYFEGNHHFKADHESAETRLFPLAKKLLRVTIERGIQLDGHRASFVTCELQGLPGRRESFSTTVWNHSISSVPEWEENFEFSEYSLGDTILFHVWSHDSITNENHSLGDAFLASNDFAPQGVFKGSIPVEVLGEMKRIPELAIEVELKPFDT